MMTHNIISRTGLKCLMLCIGAMQMLNLSAQEDNKKPQWLPEVHGTIRAKYESQFEQAASNRFQVRNARFSVNGAVSSAITYKVQIDLSDKGKMSMKDAWTGIALASGWKIKMGQFRIPVTIDAHRSPHVQFFANRSFMAKQVGSVRDIGACLSYSSASIIPFKLEAAIFNGNGLTRDEQEEWHRGESFAIRGQIYPNATSNITLGMTASQPEANGVRQYMYNAGAFTKLGAVHLEAEYMYKHFGGHAFDNVNCFNAQTYYQMPVKCHQLYGIRFLARYDQMGNHSDGVTRDESGALSIKHPERKRFTTGMTFCFAQKYHIAELRVNYENYFYKKETVQYANPSEHDKIVVEFMTHF